LSKGKTLSEKEEGLRTLYLRLEKYRETSDGVISSILSNSELGDEDYTYKLKIRPEFYDIDDFEHEDLRLGSFELHQTVAIEMFIYEDILRQNNEKIKQMMLWFHEFIRGGMLYIQTCDYCDDAQVVCGAVERFGWFQCCEKTACERCEIRNDDMDPESTILICRHCKSAIKAEEYYHDFEDSFDD